MEMLCPFKSDKLPVCC